jgi:hypothetical protein
MGMGKDFVQVSVSGSSCSDCGNTSKTWRGENMTNLLITREKGQRKGVQIILGDLVKLRTFKVR